MSSRCIHYMYHTTISGGAGWGWFYTKSGNYNLQLISPAEYND